MSKIIYYQEHSTPLGQVILATTEQGICGIYFVDQRHFNGCDGWQKLSHPHLDKAAKQLDDYFRGRRKEFDLVLDLSVFGTPFQKTVWHALQTIPFGTTSTYGWQANQINKPKAVRAVGGAIGKNPISIVVPCHRVIGANGTLTGYAGGLDRKKALLKLEGLLDR